MPRKASEKPAALGRPKSRAPHNEVDHDRNHETIRERAPSPPQGLFPEYRVRAPNPLTEKEKAQVAAYRELRDRINRGPLYAVLGDNVKVTKQKGYKPSGRPLMDPFDGVETYSQRYQVRKKTLPKLDTRPYVLKFFPKELWGTLDPSLSSQRSANSEKRKLQLSSARLARLDVENADAFGTKKDGMEDDGDEDAAAQDGEMAEEMKDDMYETDEDDKGGDYNAEGYFDGGGEDAGDDYDAGDGGDDSYD